MTDRRIEAVRHLRVDASVSAHLGSQRLLDPGTEAFADLQTDQEELVAGSGRLLEDADHAGPVAVRMHEGPDGVLERLERRRVCTNAFGRCREEVIGKHVDELAQHIVLGVEVRVERAVRDVRGLCDVRDPCLEVALCFEGALRRRQ